MSLKLDHKLRFEPFVIHQMVDETGHYNLKLDPEFPFLQQFSSVCGWPTFTAETRRTRRRRRVFSAFSASLR